MLISNAVTSEIMYSINKDKYMFLLDNYIECYNSIDHQQQYTSKKAALQCSDM